MRGDAAADVAVGSRRADLADAPPDDAAERIAAVALNAVLGVGPVRQLALLARHGTALAALATLSPSTATAALAEAQRHLDAARRAGARLLLVGDPGYPASLRELHDPPTVLWALGDVSLALGEVDGPSAVVAGPAAARPSPGGPDAVVARDAAPPVRVAVVGTRQPSAYGARVAAELARALAERRVVVVSGMAAGIDAAAHFAALDAGAPSIAVLGTGVDVAYPARHRPLHRRLAARGLVLSELPPGAPGTPGAFPRRNRIIAALCRLTIVVEAGARSGALITAGHALDLGRGVAAVPGRIDAPEAAGSNALLRDGAHVLTDVEAALELIGIDGHAGDPVARMARPAPLARPATPELGGDERVVWDALAAAAPDVDTLTARAGLPPSRCLAALGTLELGGHVTFDAAGTIRRAG